MDSDPFFVITRSGRPSPFRSPTATLVGTADSPTVGATEKTGSLPIASTAVAADCDFAAFPQNPATNNAQSIIIHEVLTRRTISHLRNIRVLQAGF
jgi:hypothetical protein